MSTHHTHFQQALQKLQTFEEGLVKQYRQKAFSDLGNSLLLRDATLLKSVPETWRKLAFTFRYGKLQAKRVAYNLAVLQGQEADDHFFAPYLPSRSRIQNKLAALELYRRKVEELMRRIGFYRVTYTADYCEKVPFEDASSKYLFCAQVVEIFQNRWDLIETLLTQRPHGFHVHFSNNVYKTYFDPGYIQLNPLTLWAEISTDMSPGTVHAILHLLSHNEAGEQTDFLYDMDVRQKQELMAIKTGFEKIYLGHDAPFRGKLRTLLTNQTKTGLTNYAFYEDNAEFLTATLPHCLSSSSPLAKSDLGRRLITFYKDYFQLR
jgi:hypothetical protein